MKDDFRDAYSSLLYALRIAEKEKRENELRALKKITGNECSVVPLQEHKRPKLTNCKNCGAVLHDNKCEFCDTEYDW